MNAFRDKGGLMSGFQQNIVTGWIARYGLAFVCVAVAMGLRLSLEMWVGPGLPTYITFYPAVMVVALLAGFRPGLVATVLVCGLVAIWIVPPIGEFAIASPVDRLGLVIFVTSGWLMCWVAELYRRNRDKVIAFEREATMRENREILRRQVELVDPVRADVIAREMQRVVRERGGTATAPQVPSGAILRRVPDMAGLVVAGVGLMVLIGWWCGLEPLKRVLSGLPAMKANTALCFLLAGVALWLRERRAVRWLGAGLIGAVAGLTLAEYLTARDFILDHLLFTDVRDASTMHPGRMTEATVLGFILTCASLFLLGERSRAALWKQQVLALGVSLIALIALFGFGYDVQLFYRLAGDASMALHTALAFLVLAAGLLIARPDGVAALFVGPGPGAQMMRRLLPVVLVVPMVLGGLIEFGVRMNWLSHDKDVTLFAVIVVVALAALVGWTARTLNRADVTRHASEEQLSNLTAVMDHAHEPLIVRELDGTIRAWNRGAELLYGWTAAEALGQHKRALLHTAGLRVEEIDRSLTSAGHWEGELLQTARDGRQITVESRQTARPTGDGRIFILESNLDITERVRAENELRRSEALLRTIIDNSADPIFLKDRAGRMLVANPATLVVLHKSAAEVLGKTDEEFYDDPTVGRQQMANDRRVMESGQTETVEESIPGPNGPRTFQSIKMPYRDTTGNVIGVIGISRDITERKRAEAEAHQRSEEALRMSEQEFHSLAEAMPQIVWATRADGWNIYFNRRWVDYTGLTLEESYGRGWNTPFHPDDRQPALDAWNHATATGDTYQIECRLRRADGSYHWFITRGVPFRDSEGRILKWFGTCTDIDDMKRAETEIRSYAAELQRSNRELEHFAYVASHDLQEPLRAVGSFSELLAKRYRGKLDNDADEFITFIVDGAKRMQNLINDLLTFSRVGTHGQPFTRVKSDEILQTALENLNVSIAESGAIITHDPLPVLVADPGQLTQLLQNLLGNAIKFHRPGVAPRIHVSATHQDDAWQLSVRDNGIGILPEYFDRIFILFQRLHGRDTYPGTGIGLAICMKIVERHGGRLWVESEPESGSTFHFTIPDNNQSP